MGEIERREETGERLKKEVLERVFDCWFRGRVLSLVNMVRHLISLV